jgi:hypothetical protein
MSFEKPSLYNTFTTTSDIRCIIDLINKYDYTDEEVSEVINIYEPYEDNNIPEVEHIEVLLMYFPKSIISHNTMNAIKKSFPDRVEPILKLQKSQSPIVSINSLNNKMNSVIIDNCIVSKFTRNELRIRPISLEKKLNPNFNINSLRKITYGNRLNDHKIIQQLADGILKYEDLNFNSAFSQGGQKS